MRRNGSRLSSPPLPPLPRPPPPNNSRGRRLSVPEDPSFQAVKMGEYFLNL